MGLLSLLVINYIYDNVVFMSIVKLRCYCFSFVLVTFVGVIFNLGEKMARYKMNLDALKKAIEIVGGVGTLASKSAVSYQSIIDWRSGKKSPSAESCKKIEKATEGQVKAEDILPDYPWSELR